MKPNRQILKEDKVSDYIKRMIINNSAYDRVQLATNVNELPEQFRQALHDGAPSIYDACARNNQNLLAYLRLYFLSYFDISHGKGPLEYVMGLARIAIGELGMFKGQNIDSDLSRLKVCVLFLHNSEDQQLKSQFDSNLNGSTYAELTRQLDGARKEFNLKNRNVLSQMAGNASEYTVIPISSFQEASKYGKYTSWCVTHWDNHFQSYTEGGRRFYFCLRKGFENVVKQNGMGCPLDEYGLSMISVLVDPEGEPNYITTRWNHENDGENNENLRTAEQLQKITGINFYQTFKPYTPEELREMGVTPLYAVQDLLDQGVKPEKIFDDISRFSDGFAKVQLNWKYNFIDTQGKLLSPDQWFDDATPFLNGYAKVYTVERKANLIGTNGKLLFPNQWFDDIDFFSEGFAEITLEKKHNFINTKGELLFPNQWFSSTRPFSEGFAAILVSGKGWNYIDTNGKVLSPNQWFNSAYDFHNGFAIVDIQWKENYIKKDGNILSSIWFDKVYSFTKDGFAIVLLNHQFNYINNQGELLSKQWFDRASDFKDNHAIVRKGNNFYIIDDQGNITENTIKIAKSDFKKIVLECVEKIRNIS